MVTGTDLNLDLLGLGYLDLRLDYLLLLTALVLKFTIIHDLSNGRDRRGRNLDKIEPDGERGRLGGRKRQYAKVLALCANDAQFLRAYLVIYFKSVRSHWKLIEL